MAYVHSREQRLGPTSPVTLDLGTLAPIVAHVGSLSSLIYSREASIPWSENLAQCLL